MGVGSNWIRCDLHVHTPASIFQGYGDKNNDATWTNFFKDLEELPPEFKIIGINDYLTLDGYKRVRAYKKSGGLSNIDCILPVIEFRIDKFGGNDKLSRINMHVIFSDSISLEVIQSQFLNGLSANYTLSDGEKAPNWHGIPSSDGLSELGKIVKQNIPENSPMHSKSDLEVGFNNFNISYAKLDELLSNPVFLNNNLTAIGKAEWADFKWNETSVAEKRTFINRADFIFQACATVAQYEKSIEKLREQKGLNYRLLDCSDAHQLSTSKQKEKIGNCFTWVKAEPSFDGLKQVALEFDTRTKISEVFPDKKAGYQVIESVQFVNGGTLFPTDPIPLSGYLSSIIGGKSTGKSLFAGLIAKACDPREYHKRCEKSDNVAWISKATPETDFMVTWRDGHQCSLNDLNSEARKVTYFPQGYLNGQIDDKELNSDELNKTLRTILAQTPKHKDAFEKHEAKIQSLQQETSTNVQKLEIKLRELREKTYELEEHGSSKDITKAIEKLQAQLNNLKSQYELSDDDYEQHDELSTQTRNLRSNLKTWNQDIATLSLVATPDAVKEFKIQSLIGVVTDQISDETIADLETGFSLLREQFLNQFSGLVSISLASLSKKKEKAEGELVKVQEQHAPILAKIKASEPLKEITHQLKTQQEKLEVAAAIEKAIQYLNTEINELADAILSSIDKRLGYLSIITDALKHPFPASQDSPSLDVTCPCKSALIRDVVRNRVVIQSNPEMKAVANNDEFKDQDTDTYKDIVSKILEQALKNELSFKRDYTLSGLLDGVLTSATYLNFDLRLGSDSFVNMSPGKRALVLLKVLVDLDLRKHPIILDQPEDDLDNRSVYQGLAEYLKRKKDDRQIIVVTHNPNVVVGADSEYVVVANQSGQDEGQDNETYRFEYIYGGLENSFIDPNSGFTLTKKGIREHVCEILDGGKSAFSKRENLYLSMKEEKEEPSAKEATPKVTSLAPKKPASITDLIAKGEPI